MPGRLGGAAFGLALAALLPGCAAISVPMGGLFGEDEDDEVVTSAVVAQSGVRVPAADWRAAKGALGQAMNRTDAGVSVMWNNPATGAHGSITPLSAAVAAAAGRTCRSFLMSRVHGEAETWHQGEACSAGAGRWTVQAVRPLAVRT